MMSDRELIGYVDLGLVRFDLHGSLAVTLRHAERRGVAVVFRAAEAIGASARGRGWGTAWRAVKLAVTRAWYEERGETPPETPEGRALRRQLQADQRRAEDVSSTTTKGPSAASLIRERLREGKTTDEIAADILRVLPGYYGGDPRGARASVHYYRHQLREKGEILPDPETSSISKEAP